VLRASTTIAVDAFPVRLILHFSLRVCFCSPCSLPSFTAAIHSAAG
jgi:hypothetical protein